jgi:hypothetical protein
MASGVVAGGSFRLGDALGRAGSVWGQLILPFFLVYVVAMLPSLAASLMVDPHDPKAIFATGYWVPALLGTLLLQVAQMATVDSAMRVADGGHAEFGQALGRTAGRLLPLIGAGIIALVLIMLGLMLLIVPGIMVALAYLVVTQVVVVERLGPWGSLQRSARLTKGFRWKLFGFVLVLMLIYGLEGATSSLGTRVLGRAGATALQLLVGPALTLFTVVATTMVYRGLVAAKDGLGGARMAAVFD